MHAPGCIKSSETQRLRVLQAKGSLRKKTMRTNFLALLVLALLSRTAFAADAAMEAKKKAIRMKATSKLKEILKELDIKFDPKLDKEGIRSLVLREDALTRWEKLHPEQKKPPRSQAGAGAGMGGDFGDMSNMFFTLLDDDKDGRLSKKEMEGLGKLAPEGAQAGAPPPEQLFQLTDADRDGYVTKEEMAVFTQQMQAMMGGGGGGMPGMGGPGGMPGMMGGGMPGMMGGGMPGMGGMPPGGMGSDDDELSSHDEL